MYGLSFNIYIALLFNRVFFSSTNEYTRTAKK
jgi:hypothetical protein